MHTPRTSRLPQRKGDDQGVVDGDGCHVRGAERHPHRHYGLYQAELLQ